MSQQELASAVGTRVMTLSAWENDKVTKHDREIVQRMADILGVEPGWILVGDAVGSSQAEAPGFAAWAAGDESNAAHDDEHAALEAMGRAAASEGFSPTPAAYSAWLVALRMYCQAPTKR